MSTENALCEAAARAAGSEAPPIPIRLDLDRSLPMVVTDAERLRVALVNILTNARNAVAGRPVADSRSEPVRLKTRLKPPGQVVIEIRDQGTGIASEDLRRDFDPYFSTRRTGTVLGLAISKNIVEGLGGTIGVSSRPGQGTEVRIELSMKV